MLLILMVRLNQPGWTMSNCDTVDFNIPLATTPAFCSKGNGTLYAAGQIPNELMFSVDIIAFGQDTFFTDLTPGVHTLYMQHSSGCIDSVDFIINEIPPLSSTITMNSEHCGQSDGTIIINAAGGRTPYVYRINSVITPEMPEYTGFSEGQVIVSVTDNMGCEVKDTVMIENAQAPEIIDIVSSPANCGTADGKLEILAQSSGSSLLFGIDGGALQGSPVFEGLAPGPYPVVVADTFGCLTEVMSNIDALDGPEIVELIGSSAHCGQADGSVEVTVEGGTEPVAFILNETPIGFDPRIENLTAGTYTIEAVDATGCSTSRLFVLDDISGVLITDVEFGYSSCDSASGVYIDVDVVAQGNVEYSVDSFNYQIDPQIVGLSSGLNTVYVRDEFGCEDSREITVPNQNPRIIRVESISSECGAADGELWAVYYASHGPYYVSVGGVNYVDGPVIRDLAAGAYTFYVRNEMGCELAFPAVVDGPPDTSPGNVMITATDCGESNGQVRINSVPGIVKYHLNGEESVNGEFNGLEAGDYVLEYTDTVGCVRDTLVTVPGMECEIYIPNIFSPNDDGVNDTFGPVIRTSQVELLSFVIADRWGGVVFECDGDCKWDGRSSGQLLSSGVYVYMIRLRDASGNERAIGGNVTLVR